MIDMHVIVAYDVETKRTEIFKKICQIYLGRIQNSIFEGDITEPQFMKLKDRLENEMVLQTILWIDLIPTSR